VSIIPFLRFFYDRLGEQRFCEPDELVELPEVVYPYRYDAICVFLNQVTNRCNIYPLRPQICSVFGRKTQCFHYNSDGYRLTRAEKRSGDYDTRDSAVAGIEGLKKVLRGKERRTDEEIMADKRFIELRSLATPELTIRVLQKIAPWMVLDVEEEGVLSG